MKKVNEIFHRLIDEDANSIVDKKTKRLEKRIRKELSKVKVPKQNTIKGTDYTYRLNLIENLKPVYL